MKNDNKFNDYSLSKNIERLKEMPILTREMVKKHTEKLFADDYQRSYTNMHITTTSGSSGEPLKIYWHVGDYYRSMKTLWDRRKKYYNISPVSKKIEFSFYDKNGDLYKIDRTNTVLSFNVAKLSNDKFIRLIYDKILEFQPEWIYVQPSLISALVNWFIKSKFKKPASVKHIELVGEVVTDNVIKLCENYFSECSVAVLYGSEEMNGIAYECPYHRMHIISENVFAEILSKGKIDETGIGEIILTNLHNVAVPFVRYNQGDLVQLLPTNKCQCGFSDKIINYIKGRVRDKININNIEVNSYMLSEYIKMLNNIFNDCIKKFKFLYIENKKTLECYIYVSNEYLHWSTAIEDEIKTLFKKDGINTRISVFISLYEPKIISKQKYHIFEIVGEKNEKNS